MKEDNHNRFQNEQYGNYWPSWQQARLSFILERYPKDFFKGKRVLELGSFNGFFGDQFASFGADVEIVEGRHDNVKKIKESCQFANNIRQGDVDKLEWEYGDYDVIVNFGLLYHLEFHHEAFLYNCIEHCKLMFLESVIYDSDDDEIFFREESYWKSGGDQSLSTLGGSTSTSWVENRLKSKNVNFQKYCDHSLNGGEHEYDWEDSNSKEPPMHKRRFWIVNCEKE